MKPTNFAVRLTQFLGEYLPAQRNVSPNTIKAYSDAFTFLLRYCRDQRDLAPEKLTLDLLDAQLLLDFLNYLVFWVFYFFFGYFGFCYFWINECSHNLLLIDFAVLPCII